MSEAMTNNPPHGKQGRGFLDGVAFVLSMVCGAGSVLAIWGWPSKPSSEGYPLAWPLFGLAFNGCLSVISILLTIAAARLIWQRRTVPRLGYSIVGLIALSVAVACFSKWSSVPTLGHGP